MRVIHANKAKRRAYMLEQSMTSSIERERDIV